MFQEYLFEIAAVVLILLVCYWCTYKQECQFAQSCNATEQESDNEEPAELVISTLHPLQAAERETRDCSCFQVPVAETNHGAVSELVL